MNQLETAIAYHEAGLCVLPARSRSKKPAVGWREYQDQRPSEQQVREWFTDPKHENIAIVCGSASDGLVVRDFDDASSYRQWASRHPGLAKRLPTSITSRGHHVYSRSTDAIKTRAFDDGELRGDKAIVIAPESVHESGVIYSWHNGIPGDFPVIDLPESGLGHSWNSDSGNNVTQTAQTTQTTQDNARRRCLCYMPSVKLAIRRTIPPKPGHRNQKLFALARELKSIPDTRDLPAMALLEVVQEWHTISLPYIGTRDFEVTWGDFCRQWSVVIHGADTNRVTLAFEAAQRRPPPPEVSFSSKEKYVLLASLCRELARDSGEFFLAVREAGQLIGVTHVQAWRWLQDFCNMGLLKKLSSGNRAQRKANEYRYLGSM